MAGARRAAVRLTQDELNRYRREVDAAAELARDYFDFAIAAFEAENPDATVAEEREFTMNLVRTALPNFTDIGATVSCDFFDEMREACGWPEDVAAQMYDMTDYAVVDEKIRYFANHLAAGNQKAFRDDVTDVTRYMVKRAAFDNMLENCKGQEIKYARVPSGFETCGFCFMLSSRGFVYTSERAAGKGNSYHKNCDCIIVPGFQGEDGDPFVKIDGYDPKTMYENWRKCAKAVGVDPRDSSEDKQKAVMAEVEMRDRHWLYTGEATKIDYSKSPRSDYGRLEKPGDYSPENITHRGKEWRDLVAHDTLSANGFKVEARSAKGLPSKYKHIDLYINGELWEVKSPENTKSGDPAPKDPLSFIHENFSKAESQFRHQYDEENKQPLDYNGRKRVVLNMTYRDVSIDDAFFARVLTEAESQHIDEVLLVVRDGKYGLGKIIRVK